MRRKIYFRADAGKEIGYGHFIRTLALADMLKDDFDGVFVTQAPTDYQRAEVAKVCPLVELPATNEKFPMFLNMLRGDEIVVLDNYFYDTDYQRAIKTKGCKLVCIDDIHDKHYVADVVINHGLSDKTLFDVEPYTRLCLGLGWALLRRPFINPNNKNRAKLKKSWFISFGGSDYNNLTAKYINIVTNQFPNATIYVVIGDAYEYANSLKKYSNIEVRKNLSANEMALCMSQCENAIVPSSTICFEALSQKCNVYSGYYVDNQKEIYSYLGSKKLIMPLGNLNRTTKLPNIAPTYVQNEFINIRDKYSRLFSSL